MVDLAGRDELPGRDMSGCIGSNHSSFFCRQASGGFWSAGSVCQPAQHSCLDLLEARLGSPFESRLPPEVDGHMRAVHLPARTVA